MPGKLLIVGGVAGGATAAARARRLDEEARIILFERGEYISFANCGLPYYIGQVIENRDDLLVTTADFFSRRYRVDVRSGQEVTAIDPQARLVTVREVASGRVYQESYDRLILSPGAEPIRPPLPGIDGERIYHLRSIPDSDRIKALLDENQAKKAVIVGAGFIGLEMAENLARRGVQVTIVEMLDQVLAPLDPEMAGLVGIHLEAKGVDLVLSDGVKSFKPLPSGLEVETVSGRRLEADLALLAIGVRPEIGLAQKAGLALGGLGGIRVDAAMRTSDPHIYAVGDAVEVVDFVTGKPALIPLAGPANRQGRIAADNAMGRRSIYKGTQGTSILKLFDLTVAATGANQKTLARNGLPFIAGTTISNSHAGYYPGAQTLWIKLLFRPGDGRLLGAQIVGGDGVDKRIDVLATALRAGLTVFDLEDLELAYAPPFSSAKDPVNIAGNAAANVLKGDMEQVTWDRLKETDWNESVLVDVRNARELEELGRLEGAVHIPLHGLRDKIAGFDPEKTYIFYCAAGLRAYLAHRIARQKGLKSLNLAGGFDTYVGAEGLIPASGPGALLKPDNS